MAVIAVPDQPRYERLPGDGSDLGRRVALDVRPAREATHVVFVRDGEAYAYAPLTPYLGAPCFYTGERQVVAPFRVRVRGPFVYVDAEPVPLGRERDDTVPCPACGHRPAPFELAWDPAARVHEHECGECGHRYPYLSLPTILFTPCPRR